MVQVELVFVAQNKTTVHLKMELKQGSTVSDALKESGLESTHPEAIDLPVGIYAKQVTLDTVLKEGDRIEIYRPLTQDPKEKRRQKARRI